MTYLSAKMCLKHLALSRTEPSVEMQMDKETSG